MKNLNRTIALLLVFIMLLPLTACGSTAAETQQEAQPVTEVEAVSEAATSEDPADVPQETPDAVEADETAENAAAGDPMPVSEQDAEPDMEEFFSSEPYIPENLEKCIIGTDDRVEVSPRGYPFSCIAYMVVEAECGCTWTGSGFMVSRYGLVTAAHCLTCYEHNKTTKNVDYYFGYRSPKDYLYKFNEGGCKWWRGQTTKGTYDNDYGYVLLSKPVGDTTGWLGCRALSDWDANNGEFYAPGYCNGVMKVGMGEMTAYSSKIFNHYIDTEPGYSGCPICDVEYYAVGINVAHCGNEYNIARRITNDLIDQMRKNGLFKK